MVRAGARLELVTGFPGPVARHVITERAGAGGQVVVIASGAGLDAAQAFCGALPGKARVVAGVSTSVDLGLQGSEAAGLQGRLGTLFHLEDGPGDQPHRHSLRAAREVVEFASSGSDVRVVALAPAGPGGRDPRRPGVLARVMRGRGHALGATLLFTGVPVAAQGPWPAAGAGRLLHLIVLLHLSVDIRRLRSVASRRLALTWAPFAARIATRAAVGDLAGDVDLVDPRPPSLSDVDRALAGMLEGAEGVDAEFLSACRRHRDRVIGRWIGHADPVDVLEGCTTQETLGGGGERVARDQGLEWVDTLGVLDRSLASVVADVKADLGEEADVRDALLG